MLPQLDKHSVLSLMENGVPTDTIPFTNSLSYIKLKMAFSSKFTGFSAAQRISI
jgi:hypothetical protein